MPRADDTSRTRRAITPIALVLALATGIVLAETRLALVAPAVAIGEAPGETGNIETVRRFYAAVNAMLRDGDDVPVEKLVAEDFVERTARFSITGDRDALIANLRSVRAVAPGARVSVLDLVAQGDRVAARVQIDGTDGAVFLGWPVDGRQLWGAVDVFRVRSGQIVESWSDRDRPAVFTPSLSIDLPIGSPSRRVVRIERWTLAAGAEQQDRRNAGTLVILVESGTLVIALDPAAKEAASAFRPDRTAATAVEERLPAGDETTLDAGEAIVLPQGAPYVLAARSGASALVVSMVALPRGRGAPSAEEGVATPVPTPQPGSTGISRTLLAGGMAVDLPAGRLTVGIGRATLIPGSSLPPHLGGVAELVAVESGTVALTVGGGTGWIMPTPAAGVHTGASATLGRGGGAFMTDGVSVAYEAPLGTAAARLLLVSLRADAGDTTPGATATG